jgi:hypothetical protein
MSDSDTFRVSGMRTVESEVLNRKTQMIMFELRGKEQQKTLKNRSVVVIHESESFHYPATHFFFDSS